MSVRKIRSDAQFVDLGRPEESPLDKLNKLVSGVGNIMSGVSAIRKQRSTEQINTITMLNETIDRARSLEDLTRLKDNVTNIPYNYNDDSINLASEAVKLKYEQSLGDFEIVQGLGDDILNEISKNLNFTNSQGEKISKNFMDMNAEELVAYSKENSKDGIISEINSLKSKMNQYMISATNVFGTYDGRNFKKTSNMAFAKNDGTKIKNSEFLAKMNSYEQSVNTMIDALGNDGVLSVEEAETLISGDNKYFRQLRQEKLRNLQVRVPELNRNINTLNTKIEDLKKPTINTSELIKEITSNPELMKNPEMLNKLTLLATGAIDKIEDLALDEGILTNRQGLLTVLQQSRTSLITELQNKLKTSDAWGFEDMFGLSADFSINDFEVIDKNKNKTTIKNVNLTDSNVDKLKNEQEKEKKKQELKNLENKGFEIIPITEESFKINLKTAETAPDTKPIKFLNLTEYDKNLVFKKLIDKSKFRGTFDNRSHEQIFNNLSLTQQSEILNKNLKKYPYSYYKKKYEKTKK